MSSLVGARRSLVDATRRGAWVVRLVTAVALLLSIASHHVGLVFHAACGAVFALASAGHVLANRRWIRTVTSRLRRGLPARVAADAGVAGALIALTGLVAGSGVAAIADLPGAGELHGTAAAGLVAGTVLHVVRNRRRLRTRGARLQSRVAGHHTRQP